MELPSLLRRARIHYMLTPRLTPSDFITDVALCGGLVAYTDLMMNGGVGEERSRTLLWNAALFISAAEINFSGGSGRPFRPIPARNAVHADQVPDWPPPRLRFLKREPEYGEYEEPIAEEVVPSEQEPQEPAQSQEPQEQPEPEPMEPPATPIVPPTPAPQSGDPVLAPPPSPAPKQPWEEDSDLDAQDGDSDDDGERLRRALGIFI
jgi:hypothetical protein